MVNFNVTGTFSLGALLEKIQLPQIKALKY